MLRHGPRTLLCLLVAAAAWIPGLSVTKPDSDLEGFVSTSAHILKGRCLRAETGTVTVAGATIPATTYTFEVEEYLKGGGPSTYTFRQVGTPEGGPFDLGQLVGLPTYSPGVEYLLFVLPVSRAGLTSPAGAGEAAFIVRNGVVEGLWVSAGEADAGLNEARRPPVGTPGEGRIPLSYHDFRRVILEEVGP